MFDPPSDPTPQIIKAEGARTQSKEGGTNMRGRGVPRRALGVRRPDSAPRLARWFVRARIALALGGGAAALALSPQAAPPPLALGGGAAALALSPQAAPPPLSLFPFVVSLLFVGAVAVVVGISTFLLLPGTIRRATFADE